MRFAIVRFVIKLSKLFNRYNTNFTLSVDVKVKVTLRLINKFKQTTLTF
jgi:hypothetical protein